ncbi:TRAP transporter large permease [Aliihoeflea sp. 2WW]|uniref:TRAP transporter large permease n=1 Tax=Aliihoeflea sp. 2WW TaxID=1381123 RepID=UPI000462ECBD|nr:TRAP transporter large permease [Aliihoeflea sp. 2WW]
MDSTAALVVALATLFGLLAARVPVAFALLAAGTAGICLFDGPGPADSTLARLPYESPARYVLIVIPFFVAMGIFAKNGRLALDAYNLASRGLRAVPGGLAIATVASCALFAAVSGSSVATIAALGPTAMREMQRHGYNSTLAAGVVGASGTLGVLIPPSIAIVLYGIITNTSIGPLLIAGIIPGILTALVYALGVVAACLYDPRLAGRGARDGQAPRSLGAAAVLPEPVPAPQAVASNAWSSILRVGFLFGVVMGGIYSGIVTATEAGAIGAVVALSMMLHDSLRAGGVRQAVSDTAASVMESVSLTSMTFMLLIGSAVFTYFLVSAGVPADFTAWMLSFDVAPWMVVALLLLAFVPLGMFLDPISMLLIGVPLAFPVVIGLGYNPLWFGILVVKMVEVGLITPPFGLNAFVVSGVSGIPVERAFAGVMWFLPLEIIVIVLIFCFPEIVTWLPGQMG